MHVTQTTALVPVHVTHTTALVPILRHSNTKLLHFVTFEESELNHVDKPKLSTSISTLQFFCQSSQLSPYLIKHIHFASPVDHVCIDNRVFEIADVCIVYHVTQQLKRQAAGVVLQCGWPVHISWHRPSLWPMAARE